MNLFQKMGVALFALSLAACADLDELLVNPNGVDPSQADANALYNSIQLTFNNVQNDPYFFAAGLARMDAETGGFTYRATHQPTEFDGMWNRIYARFLPDAENFIRIAENNNQDAAAASVKVLQAYVYMQLVDLFNDVPLTEALQGDADEAIFNPSRTPGAEVYAEAEALLDEAIMQLDSASDFTNYFDNFYGGSAADWASLARTLKIRAATTTRLVGGADNLGALVEAGDIIDENSENFEWTYGTNRNNPNNRHPFYNDGYEIEDDQVYQSNWYMWLLAESKGFQDPRVRYYFYRQDRNIFPDAVEDDPNAFDCIYTDVPDPDAIPPHYEDISDDMPYCMGSYDLGYFGRDHLNGSGIPPDNPYRTVPGVYPAGGLFDNGTSPNEPVTNDGVDGALGAGIEPIWQASFTHFVLAEAAVEGLYEGDAAELLEAGIRLSFERVSDFEALVDGNVVVATTPRVVLQSETFVADSVYDEYVEFVLDEFDGAEDDDARLAIVAREYLIALWGNGLEAYNLYRRTCLPADIQPGIDENAGPFIRSALYPSVHVDRNINAEQKSDFTVPVFWDTNDASCNY